MFIIIVGFMFLPIMLSLAVLLDIWDAKHMPWKRRIPFFILFIWLLLFSSAATFSMLVEQGVI